MQEIIDLNVHRAQKIFDQFLLGEISHQDAVSKLVWTFGIEPMQAKLLLDEIDR